MPRANELQKPRMAADRNAVEVLRVWAAPGAPHQLVLRTAWKEPGAWGLLLADIARHAANAYAAEGHDRAAVLERISVFLNEEIAKPADANSTMPVTPR